MFQVFHILVNQDAKGNNAAVDVFIMNATVPAAVTITLEMIKEMSGWTGGGPGLHSHEIVHPIKYKFSV